MAILGIDEVGRGPLAGPLVVGAVILPENNPDWILELRDSKKLTAKRREELSKKILSESATGLGWVSAVEVDEHGISDSLKLATKRAVKSIQSLHVPFSQIIIDGKVNFLKGTNLEKYVSTMPKADDLIREVSAASIIAKVARDDYMVRLARKYPKYGFEKHVGYGTAKHLAAISEFGICPEHRKSFEPIKSMVGFSREKTVVKNTTVIGNRGEEEVVKYLAGKGHEIVARNYKSKYYEIDIVSVLNNEIFFTEVKYRKNDYFGGGLDVINEKKKKRMIFAAECFLKNELRFSHYSPILAVADVVGDEFKVNDWFCLGF